MQNAHDMLASASDKVSEINKVKCGHCRQSGTLVVEPRVSEVDAMCKGKGGCGRWSRLPVVNRNVAAPASNAEKKRGRERPDTPALSFRPVSNPSIIHGKLLHDISVLDDALCQSAIRFHKAMKCMKGELQNLLASAAREAEKSAMNEKSSAMNEKSAKDLVGQDTMKMLASAAELHDTAPPS